MTNSEQKTAGAELKNEKDALHFVSLGHNLEYVPRKLMTARVCQAAFKQQPYSRTFSYVPEKHRTFEMFLKASPDYGTETRDFAECHLQVEWGISVSAFVALKKKSKLPHFKNNTPKNVIDACYIKAFNEDAGVFTSMPKDLIPKILKNPLNVNKIVRYSPCNDSYSRSNPWLGAALIKLIPEDKITQAVIEIIQEKLEAAAKEGTRYFFDVPERYVTNTLYKLFLEKNPNSLDSIPQDRITESMCDIAVKKDGRALKYVPQDWKSKFYVDVVKSGNGLYTIPEEDRTDRLCTLAVEQGVTQFEYVPEDKRTYALCLQAIDKNAEMAEFVPLQNFDEEMIIRLIISIFRNNWEHDYYLNDIASWKKEEGQKEPLLSTIFNSFFKEKEDTYCRAEELKEIMHKVIEREGKLYFAAMDYSGENDVKTGHRTFNSGMWKKFFKDCVGFEHAVTAARTDIETVTGFKQDVQAAVWKEFLNNNK